MASSLNADNGVVSGSAGLKSTADTSGVLALQSNGSTALSIATNLNVTLTNPLPVASGGTGATSLSGITVGTATNATNATTSTNLAGGSAGTVPYQSASGTTQMLAAGTSGQVLTSSGAGAPTWTTPSSFGVTSVGSIVRKPGAQLFLATPDNQLLTGGYVPQALLLSTGTTFRGVTLPQYSTYYSVWIASNSASNLPCCMSKDGINWVDVFTQPTDYGGNPPTDNSKYVVDDGNGYIYCFGVDINSTTLGYWYKTSPGASWSGFVSIDSNTSNRNFFSAQYVWFGSTSTSGIVVAWSNNSTSYVSVIDTGTSITNKISSSNSNGQSMSMDWNATAGRVVVMSRAASAGYYAVMYVSGSNVYNSWTGVTQSACGFDPGSNTSNLKPVVGPSGAVMFSSNFGSGSYYYAAAGSLGSTWSNTSAGGNQILYMGHNGTSWYQAKGQPGALSTNTGQFSGFYTSSAATPSSLSFSGAAPLMPLDTGTPTAVTIGAGQWTQRKY